MLRNYDPQTGRFLQNDPYDQFASGYVGMGNYPVNGVDPSGGLSGPGSAIAQVACSGSERGCWEKSYHWTNCPATTKAKNRLLVKVHFNNLELKLLWVYAKYCVVA